MLKILYIHQEEKKVLSFETFIGKVKKCQTLERKYWLSRIMYPNTLTSGKSSNGMINDKSSIGKSIK